MKSLIFSEKSTYKVAVLIKDTSFRKGEMDNYYVSPLELLGIDRTNVLAVSLPYVNNKASANLCKSFLETLLPKLVTVGTEYIYCADSTYFKALTGVAKSESSLGYVVPCKFVGYEHLKVVYGLNFTSLQYNPAQQPKLDLSLKTLSDEWNGGATVIGLDIIDSAEYPYEPHDIKAALDKLHIYSHLTVDIEAFSLVLQEAYLGSIAFAWDNGNGIAFHIDYTPIENELGYFGMRVPNQTTRQILKQFLIDYKGTLIAHNCTYDFKVLVFELFMKDPLDTKGLLEGLDILTNKFHDTKVIAYLATNSTAGNKLSLKDLAHEFAGNYAQSEIKDIRRIEGNDLLKYNLTDCLATWYVFHKMYPIMVKDNQEELYKTLMIDSLKLIIQLELTGMPMYMPRIKAAKKALIKVANQHIATLNGSAFVRMTTHLLKVSAMEAANERLKKLRKTVNDFPKVVFNPNSGDQVARLLHEVMGLPIIDVTPTKSPATGMDTLEKLLNHTTDPKKLSVINALLGLGSVVKILSAFIPAFERAFYKSDGCWYLHGNFNLNGAVSGRLSSSKVNLQQIPSNSIYAEIIKACFVAPKGWLMTAADFASLEDRISALLTKDTNKLRVYVDGYDGHALRAWSYFPEEYVGVPFTVEAINATVKTHSTWRQLSKAPTFALTYLGTYRTLMNNCGFSEQMARSIETNYHKLYKESDEYVAQRINQACKDGYVEVAFGLRIRTPLLAQSILGSKRTMHEAEAEGRTVGNALGQSYNLLNNRAAVAFMKLVWASKYRYDIKPISLIHDAIYLLIRDNVEVVKWVNDNLIECMKWNELPEIQHETVKLGAELDIFYSGWHQKVTIPNGATEAEIIAACKSCATKYKEK